MTKMSLAISKILKEEGFIEEFETYTENNKNYILISLKYIGKSRESVICKIQRVSKPGLRIYSNSKKLPKVLNNLGIAIISTSKGVMTNLKAKELGIGGEVLCYIW
jgi:small subunit ribosomal protein S8